MIPKWVYVIALGFLAFALYTDPTSLGGMAASFVGFIGDILEAILQALGSATQ